MNLQSFLLKAINFINETIIPLILAVAFLVFLFNIARYFILKQDDKREEARRIALWGILAFVVIVSIWGIVNLLVSGFDFDRQNAPCPDFNPNCDQRGGEAWENREPECVGGIICVYEEDGHRTCFAC
jgi:amino acid transporter